MKMSSTTVRRFWPPRPWRAGAGASHQTEARVTSLPPGWPAQSRSLINPTWILWEELSFWPFSTVWHRVGIWIFCHNAFQSYTFTNYNGGCFHWVHFLSGIWIWMGACMYGVPYSANNVTELTSDDLTQASRKLLSRHSHRPNLFINISNTW